MLGKGRRSRQDAGCLIGRPAKGAAATARRARVDLDTDRRLNLSLVSHRSFDVAF